MRRRLGKEPSSPSVASAAVAEAVLGDDDLLREILVRVEHPTCLVYAALVSKRWLRHASDPPFLRRFRRLHPPRLLGLYIDECTEISPPRQFVSLPRPPELDIVFRRASFDVGVNGMGCITDVRNGRFITFLFKESPVGFSVCSPLHPARDLHFIVPNPPKDLDRDAARCDRYHFLPEDGGDGRTWIAAKLWCSGPKIFAQTFVAQGRAWVEARTSEPIMPPSSWVKYRRCALLVNDKIYMLGSTGYIVGLNLASMNLFVINLPDGVQPVDTEVLELSLAEDSGFYLIYLKGLHIHIWCHDTDEDDAGEWHLVDTISVCQAIGNIAKPGWESGYLDADRVGDNAELLLKVHREVFYLHIKSRKVEKVFEIPSHYRNYGPSLNDGLASHLSSTAQ